MPSTKTLTVMDLYGACVRRLEQQMEAQTARFETACLLQEVLGWDKNALIAHGRETVPPEKVEQLETLLRRREAGYPLQYLLGSWEFWGLDFAVGEGVLIPRADTEILCETVLELAKDFEKPILADLCSGSGCLPVVFAKELPQAPRIYALELSDEALPYLQKNVDKHCPGRVTVLQEDVLTWQPPEKLNLISCNPPYLSQEEMGQLQREVTFEPAMALEAPEEGLYFYRQLSRRCWDWLAPGGILAFEIGWKQGPAVLNLLREAGFKSPQLRQDYGGRDRVVWGRKE